MEYRSGIVLIGNTELTGLYTAQEEAASVKSHADRGYRFKQAMLDYSGTS